MVRWSNTAKVRFEGLPGLFYELKARDPGLHSLKPTSPSLKLETERWSERSVKGAIDQQ